MLSTRFDAQYVLGYLVTGVVATTLVALIVFMIAFVLCYVVSLVVGYANVWPAIDRAALVSQMAIYSGLAVLVINAIVDRVAIGYVIMAGLLATFIVLIYAMCRTPRTVQEYRQEQAE